MINISNILKDVPEGTKLYSPIFGPCRLKEVNDLGIKVICDSGQTTETFLYDGRYGIGGECMLFPPNEKDWFSFGVYKKGERIEKINKNTNTFFIITDVDYDEKYYTVDEYHKNTNVFVKTDFISFNNILNYDFYVTPTKFKEHDIVTLIGIDGRKWICKLKHITDKEIFFHYGTYAIDSKEHKMKKILVDSYYDINTTDKLRLSTEKEKKIYYEIESTLCCEEYFDKGKDKLLAIKGDENKGKDIRDVFISLGGSDMTTRPFNDDTQYFYIDEDGDILNQDANTVTPEHFVKYTIDGFLFSFPYRINDFVKLQENGNDVKVTNMFWNGTQVIHEVQEDNGKFYYNLTTLDLCPMVDNSSNVEDGNEMEKVDDEQFYFVRRPDNMVEYSGNLPSNCNLEVIKQKHKIFKTKEEAEEYQKIVGIPSNKEKLNKLFKEAGLDITYGYSTENKVESTGYMQMGKTIAVIFNDANYEDEVELQLGDYEIEVRDGKTYAVKKKPAYPKTYEECCKVLKISKRAQLSYTNPEVECSNAYFSDEKYLLDAFMMLRICRNAYWKIAGEQMGLNKPWEPSNTKDKYIIRRAGDEILKGYNISCVLEFPTEEMRDAFYENFKELIEQCKELL